MRHEDPADALGLTPFEVGFVLGLLLGEGYFGGDQVKATVTVRMHVRHEQTLRWLEQRFPGSKVYGPYWFDGRHFMQWMARGDVLYKVIVPLVGRHLDSIDDHVSARFRRMCARYGLWWDDGEEYGRLNIRRAA